MELVGQRLGRYDIVAWLGDGAHVHAFLARDEANQRDVVIKVIKDTFARTEDYVRRFHEEAQAAVELNHPHMVRIYDYNQEGDVLYLVEAFLPGGSLLDIFSRQEGPLPAQTTLDTLDQIASVLDYAHEHGIVHGDLKPENVLYDEQGNAYLSDLGITKELSKEAARTRAGLEFGNPNYMAPEEWQGGSSGPRTDVYALGTLLFEMLTGRLPFSAPATGAGFAFMHLNHLMSAPLSLRALRPDLPSAAESVVNGAIDKDPDRRFASAGDFARAFHDALANRVDAPAEQGPSAQAESLPPAEAALGLFSRARAAASQPVSQPASAPAMSAAQSAPSAVPARPSRAEDVTTYFALAVLIALLFGIAIGRRLPGARG